MKPRGKPQERVLSCLAPLLFGGEAAVDALYEIAGRNVRDLMDGTPQHIVYSV
jgi:hypothetical protein